MYGAKIGVNPFQVPTSYTVIDVIGTVTQVTPSFVENKFEADGDGYFDLMFAFAQSGTGRFNAGESIAYRFTGSGLDVSDFQYRSMGAGNSPNGLYTAAHVNGITGGKSGWITPVPVPLSLLLLGSGLIGVVAVRRRVDSGQPKQA